jgi:prepilin-type N-terminal cleavage/methylation domain-containing protein
VKAQLPLISVQTAKSTRLLGRREGFSLVEILTVLAITSILTVLAMSSLSALRSTSLTSSGNQIVDVFAMARQNSISHNAYTAVVIKSQGTGAYSSYCLLELTRQPDWSSSAWTVISPWHSLGKGVVFESGQSTDTFTSAAVTLPQPLPTTFPLPFQGQSILTSSTVYQCFQPDGTLSTQPAPPTRLVLRLIEGIVDPSSGTFTYQGTTVSGKQVSYYDLVFVGNTGVTKIERP